MGEVPLVIAAPARLAKGASPSSPVQSEPARGPLAPHETVASRPPAAALDSLRALMTCVKASGRRGEARPDLHEEIARAMGEQRTGRRQERWVVIGDAGFTAHRLGNCARAASTRANSSRGPIPGR